MTALEPSARALYSVYPASPTSVRVVGENAAHYYFDGSGWSIQSGFAITLSWTTGTGALDAWMVGDNARVVHTDQSDGGMALRNYPTTGTNALTDHYGAFALGPSEALVVGRAGVVYHHLPDASVVLEEDAGASQALNAIWGSSASDVWAVGPSGAVRRRLDGGWSAMDAGVRTSLYSIHGSSSSDIWTTGQGGVVWHFDGSAWQAMDAGSAPAIYGVWAAAPDDVWFVGYAGRIVHYDGCRFTQVPSAWPWHLNAVRGISAIDVWAVGYDGGILRFTR